MGIFKIMREEGGEVHNPTIPPHLFELKIKY